MTGQIKLAAILDRVEFGTSNCTYDFDLPPSTQTLLFGQFFFLSTKIQYEHARELIYLFLKLKGGAIFMNTLYSSSKLELEMYSQYFVSYSGKSLS